jgi:hypothetical protein
MATDPHDPPDEPGDEAGGGHQQPGGQSNPFAGTPLEQIFGALGGGQMPDLSQLMMQVQSMMSPTAGLLVAAPGLVAGLVGRVVGVRGHAANLLVRSWHGS